MRAHIVRSHPRLVLLAFCLLCWLPGWFTLPATDRDEARFAQATKQMLETGDFVTIRNGDEARNRKPVGIHWLQVPGVAAARAIGLGSVNPIWPYRLPSLLGALVAVLGTHAIGRRLFDPPTALLAALLLAGSMLLTVEAHLAKTDAVLLGATVIAMGVLARAHAGDAVPRRTAASFWLAAAVGILVKGPILPLIAGVAVGVLTLVERRARWLGALRPAWGVPVLLVLVLPWFVAIGFATHGAFFRDSVGGDLAGKLVGGAEAHGAPPGTHLALLPLTLFPSGWAALAAAPAIWARRRQPAVRFLLAWLAAWLVFEAAPTKLPHYVLPLLPPLCLLVAGAAGATMATRWHRVASALGHLAAGALVAGTVAVCVVAGFGWPVIVAVALATGLGAGAAWFVPAPSRLVLGLAAVPLLYWAVLGVALPNAAPFWLSARVAAATGPSELAASGYSEPSLRFQAGTNTTFVEPEAAAAWLGAAPGRVAVIEARVLPRFRAAVGPGVRAFAELSGIDYSNGRRMALTLFRMP